MNPEDLLHAMLDIASPSGDEEHLAVFLEKTVRDMGFDSRRDEAGNLIADIGTGRGPTVMLLSPHCTPTRY